MTPRGTASSARTARGRAGSKTGAGKTGSPGARLSGIDAARGLALLGMMATLVFPTFESNAQLSPTWVGLVFSGRASA
jgi:uncharacterized membrane protein